jgi:hypothetical protein
MRVFVDNVVLRKIVGEDLFDRMIDCAHVFRSELHFGAERMEYFLDVDFPAQIEVYAYDNDMVDSYDALMSVVGKIERVFEERTGGKLESYWDDSGENNLVATGLFVLTPVAERIGHEKNINWFGLVFGT